MKILLIISALTWELPQTILALILIAYNKGIKEIHFYKSTWFIITKKEYNHKGSQGVSLGRIVLIGTKLFKNERWKKHEYGHTLQSLIFGWFYLPVIGFLSYGHNFIWRGLWIEKKLYWELYPEKQADFFGLVTKEEIKRDF